MQERASSTACWKSFTSVVHTFFPFVVALLTLTTSLRAQVPNSSFETWRDGAPEGWLAANIPGVRTTVLRTADAHSGFFAVQGTVVASGFQRAAPSIVTGSGTVFAPYPGFRSTTKPLALEGWYKFSGATDDMIKISVWIKGGGFTVGHAEATITNATTDYTRFVVPIVYDGESAPDTATIMIEIVDPIANTDERLDAGAMMTIDDVTFAYTLDVPTEIRSTNSIRIIDILGRELFSGSKLEAERLYGSTPLKLLRLSGTSEATYLLIR